MRTKIGFCSIIICIMLQCGPVVSKEKLLMVKRIALVSITQNAVPKDENPNSSGQSSNIGIMDSVNLIKNTVEVISSGDFKNAGMQMNNSMLTKALNKVSTIGKENGWEILYGSIVTKTNAYKKFDSAFNSLFNNSFSGRNNPAQEEKISAEGYGPHLYWYVTDRNNHASLMASDKIKTLVIEICNELKVDAIMLIDTDVNYRYSAGMFGVGSSTSMIAVASSIILDKEGSPLYFMREAKDTYDAKAVIDGKFSIVSGKVIKDTNSESIIQAALEASILKLSAYITKNLK